MYDPGAFASGVPEHQVPLFQILFSKQQQSIKPAWSDLVTAAPPRSCDQLFCFSVTIPDRKILREECLLSLAVSEGSSTMAGKRSGVVQEYVAVRGCSHRGGTGEQRLRFSLGNKQAAPLAGDQTFKT